MDNRIDECVHNREIICWPYNQPDIRVYLRNKWISITANKSCKDNTVVDAALKMKYVFTVTSLPKNEDIEHKLIIN